MKKTIVLSSILLAVLFSALVYSQSSPETMSRIRDNTTATSVADVTAMGATQPITNFGLNTAAGCYYASAGVWYQWTGALTNSDAVPPATTRAPYVAGFGHYFDGTNWRRVTGETYDGALATTNAPVMIGLNAYWNGVAAQRWEGEAWDTSLATTTNPNINAFGVYYNGAAATRWAGEAWDTTIANTNAPETIALNAFYDLGATAGYRWQGEAVDDDMTAAPVAPWVAAYGVFRNLDGGLIGSQRVTGESWDSSMTAAPVNLNVNSWGVFYNNSVGANRGAYWTGEAAGDTIGSTAPTVLNIGHFYNGSNYQRWKGETVDSSMTAAPVAPFTAAYNVFYNGTNAQYWQGSVLSSETTANTTYAPHTKDHNYCYDATSGSWRWVNVIDTQADGQASTLNGMVTSSIGYAYNGSTFDMMRVGASNELQTTDVATRPGEDAANDWRKVKKEQTGVYTPAATVGTAVTAGTSPVIVLAAIEAMSDINWCVYLKNTDGADAFTDAFIDTSPNNSDWVTLTWTDCDSLAAGATCVYCVSNNAYRYIRVRVSSAADLTVSAWYVSNKG